MGDDDLFPTREEILAGRGVANRDVRRARALVYLIEQESLRSTDRDRALSSLGMAAEGMGVAVDIEQFLDDEAQRGALPGEGDEAYLVSFRAARRSSSDPQARLIETQASSWASLVPTRVELRARVLDLLSQRYTLNTRSARRTLDVLGAGDPGFAEVFARVAGRSLDEAVPEARRRWWHVFQRA